MNLEMPAAKKLTLSLLLWAMLALGPANFSSIRAEDEIVLPVRIDEENDVNPVEETTSPVSEDEDTPIAEPALPKTERDDGGYDQNAVQTSKGNQGISNVFYDSDLRQAIQDLAVAAGRTVMIDPAVGGFVTADIRNKSLDEALKILLAGTGFLVHETDEYLLVFSPEPESPAFQELAVTKMYQLNYLDATEASKMLPESLERYVKPRAESNAVAITAPEPVVEQVRKALDAIDRTPRQFLLESRIVVLEKSDLLDLGVKWQWPTVQAGAYSTDALHGPDAPANAASWPWAIQMGYTPSGELTDGIVAQINALVVNDQATVIASPRLMAQNDEQALIQVTTEEYFEIVTEGYYSNNELEKIESGTVLKIIPTMGENGHISLKIEAEVSDVVARGENDLPVVSRRITKNSVWVEDGGTATIAGLADSRKREAEQKVPFLSRLPLLGRFFRNDINDGAQREVAIFITARSIDEAEPVRGLDMPESMLRMNGTMEDYMMHPDEESPKEKH